MEHVATASRQMNQLKNITEDYGKILTALQHAVVECDQKMEAYKEKNRFFEDWANVPTGLQAHKHVAQSIEPE